jgi:thiamine biosynthesis protein ThiS
MSQEIQIQVNGSKKTIHSGLSLVDLIGILKLESGQIAIEVNRVIVKKENWNELILQENDLVEIVHFVGGGAL